MATLVALIGSLLAAFVPAFVRNLHASRWAEPLDGLGSIAARATALASGLPPALAYPETVGRTPAHVPAGKRVSDPEGTWSHPTWRLLDFQQEQPHFFSFDFTSTHDATSAQFIARAVGDLDGDGELSEFSIVGEVRGGAEPFVYPVRLHREVE